MQITLKEAADLVDGTHHGPDHMILRGAGTLSSARQNEITFVESKKMLQRLEHSAAGVVLVPFEFHLEDRAHIQVDKVRDAFAKLVAKFRPHRVSRRTGISPDARISESAMIAEDVDIHFGAAIHEDVHVAQGCTIHANVVIMAGSRIDENVTIFPGAVLYIDTIVGPRCIIHANAVLGAYGFGYDTVEGKHQRGAQLGYVELEADVEIGAGTTVDRGSYGATVIGSGTKIDNQVMIAHNCRIGRHNLICSQVGVAGSSSTGDHVVMAGQVGVPDHIHIGDQSILGAKSGVMRDVPSRVTMLGIPATLEREQMQRLAALARLPEMRKQLRALQRRVDDLVANTQGGHAQKDAA